MGGGITRQCVAAFSGSLAMMMSGTSYGWTSAVLQRLKDPANSFHLTLAQSSLMVSIINFGELSSPIPSGYLADKIGRKYTLLLSAPVYIVSWILVTTVKHVYALYLVRILQGVGMGMVCTVVPLYLSEIAGPRIRGFIGTLYSVMWSLGIMFEYCVGPYVPYNDLAYISNFLPILFVASFVWMPESPYYLLMKNKVKRAEHTLMWLRDRDNVQTELKEISESLKNEKTDDNKSSCSELVTNKITFKFLIVAQILTVVKFMSGYASILSFASITFLNDKNSLITADQFAILTGAVNVVCSVLAGSVVDRLGRRPLFLVSTAGCAVFLALTAVVYFIIDKTDFSSDSFGWLTFATISLYFIFYSFGLGPLVPLIQAEFFPSSVRGIASGATVISGSVSIFLSMIIYQDISETVGMYVNFTISALFCFFGIIFIAVFVPETKGRTFAEIQREAAMKTNKVCSEVTRL